jgi:hypothetical protein
MKTYIKKNSNGAKLWLEHSLQQQFEGTGTTLEHCVVVEFPFLCSSLLEPP